MVIFNSYVSHYQRVNHHDIQQKIPIHQRSAQLDPVHPTRVQRETLKSQLPNCDIRTSAVSSEVSPTHEERSRGHIWGPKNV